MTDAIVIEHCGRGMIARLYLEKRADRDYEVTCNDLFVVASPFETFPEWVCAGATGIASAIEALTQPLMDDLDNEDDVAGVRVGYQVNGLLAIAYGDEVRYVPDFLLADAIRRLVKAMSE